MERDVCQEFCVELEKHRELMKYLICAVEELDKYRAEFLIFQRIFRRMSQPMIKLMSKRHKIFLNEHFKSFYGAIIFVQYDLC